MLFSEYKNHINLIECGSIKIFMNSMLMEIFNPKDLSLVDKHSIDRFYKYILYKYDPHTNISANRDLTIDPNNDNSPIDETSYIPSIDQLKDTVKLCSSCIESLLKDKTASVGDRIFLRNLPLKCYAVIQIEDLKRNNDGSYIINCVLLTYWGGGNDKSTNVTKIWIDYDGANCYQQTPTGEFSTTTGKKVYAPKPQKQKMSPELKAALRQKK